VEWIRGEDFLAVYDGETSRGTLNLESVLAQILQRLEWAKENVEAPTGRVPVILTPNATSLLWGTVDAALSGKRVLEKSSPWSDRQGDLVATPQLSLAQHPNLQPYDCPFDDEGTPTQDLALIEAGRAVQFYCDRKTAKQLQQANTGNGFRPGLGSYPTPDLINLVVEPRSGSLTDFIRQLDHGIVIDQMLGEGAEISGDFSVNIDLGYRVEKGQIVGRVKDTMVAGNVYTALKELVGIGCDRVWSGAYYTPSLLLAELSVVG
jgi:PmbA protein